MASFPYKTIHSQDGEIRLLLLKPAKHIHSPIICELECTYLSSQPKFEALSYVWGDKGTGTSIQVNGYEHDVFENVEAALRRLRRDGEVRTLWIDVICINQKDIEERQLQVLLMRQIYEQAEQVCAWLGELSYGTRAGLKNDHSSLWTHLGISQSSRLSDMVNDMGNFTAMISETILGEIRELLVRPWWTRVWIVQEVIVAKKVLLMCGGETIDWAFFDSSFNARMPANGISEVFGVILNPESHTVQSSYQQLTRFREIWTSRTTGISIYALLYEFRHLDCTDSRDRIFAFLNLDPTMTDMKIKPNYQASVTQVYTDLASQILERHKTLDILNCKREWMGIEDPQKPVVAYSIADQGKYHDIQAKIQGSHIKKTRKGWVKLPAGWERVHLDDLRYHYHNHITGEYQEASPLHGTGPSAPQHLHQRRICPEGWTKRWDNLGRAVVSFEATGALERKIDHLKEDLRSLPSWVPCWATPTHLDPAPLLDWLGSLPKYCAAGQTSATVHSTNGALSLDGVLFDAIQEMAEPWHPEPARPVISRLGIPILESWERLALKEPINCPYSKSGGRAEALWRTHVADYIGPEAAPAEWGRYVRCWYDKVGWAEELATINNSFLLTLWKKNLVNQGLLRYYDKLSKEDGIKSFFARTVESLYVIKRYGEVLLRISRACAHRALFVTKKGYIGLAPWNAAVGDKVCILLGGRTPFLLRGLPGTERYALVGEAYVQGIMGGEALNLEGTVGSRQTFTLV